MALVSSTSNFMTRCRFFAAGFLAVFVAFAFISGSFANLGHDKQRVLHSLQPHKALYEISLESTRSSSQIVNVDGQMMYEWHPTCDAWLSNHRFNILYEYADSPALNITSDFSTFEPFDGKGINFSSQRKRDGDLFEELRGHASIEDEGTGKAMYSLPEDLEFHLPEGTVFPMGHTLGVIEKIKAGEKFYTSTIFDGSDDRGPIEVNTFIGEEINAMAQMTPSADIDTALVNTKAHKVQLAFFVIEEESETPDYEMSAIFHENGVISDMVIAYDNFSISQKLVALEPLEGNCEQE